MSKRSLLIAVAALVIVGGGCSQIQRRFVPPVPPAPAVVTTTPTDNLVQPPKHTVGEIYVYPAARSIAGEKQNLYESTVDGEKLLVRDVSKQLGTDFELAPTVAGGREVKNDNFVFFSTDCGCDGGWQTYVFDKKTRKFRNDTAGAALLSRGHTPLSEFFSPDNNYYATVLRQEKGVETGNSIVFVDLRSLEVTHRFVERKPYNLFATISEFDGETTIDPSVTKWESPMLFSVGLYKEHAKSGEMLKPADVQVVDVSKKSAFPIKSGSFSLGAYSDTLFVSAQDGYDIAVKSGITSEAGQWTAEKAGSCFLVNGAPSQGKYLLFTCYKTKDNVFGGDFFVYPLDKQMLSGVSSEIFPKPLMSVNDNSFFVSPNGRFVAELTERGTQETVVIYDMNELRVAQTYDIPQGKFMHERTNSSNARIPGAQTKWKKDSLFSLALYNTAPTEHVRSAAQVVNITVK